MQWNEVRAIVEALEEAYPDAEIEQTSLQDLYDLILDLQDFSDDPENVKQSELKKIHEAWIDFRLEN